MFLVNLTRLFTAKWENGFTHTSTQKLRKFIERVSLLNVCNCIPVQEGEEVAEEGNTRFLNNFAVEIKGEEGRAKDATQGVNEEKRR